MRPLPCLDMSWSACVNRDAIRYAFSILLLSLQPLELMGPNATLEVAEELVQLRIVELVFSCDGTTNDMETFLPEALDVDVSGLAQTSMPTKAPGSGIPLCVDACRCTTCRQALAVLAKAARSVLSRVASSPSAGVSNN